MSQRHALGGLATLFMGSMPDVGGLQPRIGIISRNSLSDTLRLAARHGLEPVEHAEPNECIPSLHTFILSLRYAERKFRILHFVRFSRICGRFLPDVPVIPMDSCRQGLKCCRF